MISKYILIRDIERCPYVPNDYEYVNWNEKNDKRLKEIAKAREYVHLTAQRYMSHKDANVRDMAIFIDWLFGHD